MQTISIIYSLKWQVKFAPHYQFTSCKKLINVKRGRVVKKVLNGSSIGYWIESKFYALSKLRTEIELIKNEKLPF